jgi:hypothetical protein
MPVNNLKNGFLISILFHLPCRCMDLPPGVFELIADMLPMPRVWQWSILRLKRRCKLAPHQAVCDINIIMDEILTDSCIFPGPQQSLLVRISQNPQVHFSLISSYICTLFRSTLFYFHLLENSFVCLFKHVVWSCPFFSVLDSPGDPEIMGHVRFFAGEHQAVE